VPPLPAAVELLRELSRVLSEMRIPWYLFGAQAVALYGLPRMTGDVDVTVEVAPAQSMALVAALERAGFQLRVKDVDDFVARTRVLPFLHLPTGLPLDVVLAGSGLEEEFLRRVREIDAGGVRVPVISPEDLIVAKILAGRPKDIDDVQGILHARGEEIDRGRVREVLHLLEKALGQSDLLASFEAAGGEIERRRL
jgi:hypothetical protein